MRYVEDIGTQGDYIERKFNRPRLYRCPHCGTKGRKVREKTRFVPHVGPLHRRSWIRAIDREEYWVFGAGGHHR